MQLHILPDYHTLSSAVADLIINQVRGKPHSVLCLAAGDTPRFTYTLLAEKSASQNVTFKNCTFIGLDEWVNVPPDKEGSCALFLRNWLFSPLSIPLRQIHLFDSMAVDPEQECEKMNKVVENMGIDLMLVGVGMNGHIGFNEPGISPHLYAHVANLDSTTQQVGQKYFSSEMELPQGITLGLKHFLESKTVIMIASGVKKSGIIKRALEGKISSEVPASLIRTHPAGIVMLDEECSLELSFRKASP